jgi:hypothetical protein
MPAMLEALDTIKAGGAGRGGRKACPPHGPHLIDAIMEGLSYAARCLKCGLVGPVCKEAPEAKLAFDQRWR